MTYSNEWQKRGLVRRFNGKITAKEIVNANLSLHGDARFDDLLYVINDFTLLEDFEVTDADIMLISSIDQIATLTNPLLKIAIVATMPDLLSWIEAYMAQMEESAYECQLFSTFKEAEEWVKPYS